MKSLFKSIGGYGILLGLIDRYLYNTIKIYKIFLCYTCNPISSNYSFNNLRNLLIEAIELHHINNMNKFLEDYSIAFLLVSDCLIRFMIGFCK
jgi:hypothetical protein